MKRKTYKNPKDFIIKVADHQPVLLKRPRKKTMPIITIDTGRITDEY